MSAALQCHPELIQGTPEWLALRKTKITATDAKTILGIDPWKTKLKLYREKISDDPPEPPTERMLRGLELEEAARELFTYKTGIKLIPKDDYRNVVIHPKKDWMMASFDGVSECDRYTVEIKCPGEKDHAIALAGKIPDHYYPQTQHQFEVKKPLKHFYFSFDGFDGPIFEVKPDFEFIDKMIVEEKKFYDNILNKVPPEPSEKDYVIRNDDIWNALATEYRCLSGQLSDLEKRQDYLKKQLIQLAGLSNIKGAGISLSQVHRKGNIDYDAILRHLNVDINLEPFRKPTSMNWRISING